MKTEIQKVMDQIGYDAVAKAIPLGHKFGRCELHGHYLSSSDNNGCCPICPVTPPSNGTTATEVSHYIDIREAVGIDGTNPQQKL